MYTRPCCLCTQVIPVGAIRVAMMISKIGHKQMRWNMCADIFISFSINPAATFLNVSLIPADYVIKQWLIPMCIHGLCTSNNHTAVITRTLYTKCPLVSYSCSSHVVLSRGNNDIIKPIPTDVLSKGWSLHVCFALTWLTSSFRTWGWV